MIVYHLGTIAAIRYVREPKPIVQPEGNYGAGILVVNIMIGLSAGAFLYALWPVLGASSDLGLRLSHMGLTSWPVFGIYYCTVNPILEELFWRRFLETDSSLPVVNDYLFAGYHMLVLGLFIRWLWCVAAFVLLVLASWIWGITAKSRNGIAVAVGSHILADIGIVLTTWLRIY